MAGLDLFKFCKSLRRTNSRNAIRKLLKRIDGIETESFKNIDMNLYSLIKKKRKYIANHLKSKKEIMTKYVEDYHGLTLKQYRKIIRDGCSECGSHKNMHLHHIIPKSDGGTNDVTNLTPLCRDCHCKKHPFMFNLYK